jgi:hydrogenase expression/formation protein HypC
MCIGFPGRVIALNGDSAVVETDGRRRQASTLYLRDIAVGDRVVVAAGAIVSRLDPADALEIDSLLRTAIERTAPDAHPAQGGRHATAT